MKRTRSSRKRGFSLIEVMISMTVFTLTMGGGLLGVRKGFEFVENARHYSNAAQILQSEVEILRLQPWAEIEQLDDDAFVSLQGKYDDTVTNHYTLSRDVTDKGIQKKQIVMTLSWKDNFGTDHSVQFSSFFTEGGINDYYQRSI